jgi:acyl-CoA reductase-like NAD-dependent aldehyde dehydrogenase
MLKETYPYYLANQAVEANTDLAVTDKYSGEVATRVALADAVAIDRAIDASVEATVPMRRLAAYERQDVLQHCVDRFRKRYEELAQALCIEAGKPIKDARGEVTRLIDTFRIAAEEAVRLPGSGEVFPMDISARARGYTGQWKRMPIGPCSFIAPFNFPLNLVAHKVAPALAAGCPFIARRRPDHRRDPCGDGPAWRRFLGAALPTGRRGPVHRGREAEAAIVYRVARRGVGAQGKGGEEEGGARTRGQRRGHRG